MIKYILPFISLFGYSKLSPQGLAVLEEIQATIAKDYSLESKIKTIQTQDFVEEEVEVERRVLVKDEGELSGKEKVEQMLRKQRELIRKQNGNDVSSLGGGKDKVQKMLEERRNNLGKYKEQLQEKKGDWTTERLRQQENWTSDKLRKISQWQEERKQIISQWLSEKEKYTKRIPEYKKTLAPIDSAPKNNIPRYKVVKVKQKILRPIFRNEEVSLPLFQQVHIIPGAFNREVDDQGIRPTCAAFAAARALEVSLGGDYNLSEQYLYWASKPSCQNGPCSKRGSWPVNAFESSKNSQTPDIPLEKDCPYVSKHEPNNETQVPLSSSCQRGKAQVKEYFRVKNFDEIINALDNNYPVIAGLKLDAHFYNNNGYIFLKDNSSTSNLDSHAKGHAITFVGYMKLPKELHKSQGDSCLIVANSWGTGWGKGGHSCLSRSWFNAYRYDIDYLAISSVKI